MLILKDIAKDYQAGDTIVPALRGIDLQFRKCEFAAILGPSGCGKTTLLNIIGGLDKYSRGDLIINGRTTKQFKDEDWDSYRNHSIGFVFQSYNLIPHQTVLDNVELALTIGGIDREERRKRALEALERVGLADQINKKPMQLSGGQMQRVAIARALVNDPDILLADEPTGALDSETSIQVMEILKDISREKLVIMVTHNPELADAYASRIIQLLDGRVVSDSNPYNDSPQEPAKAEQQKKPSMSFLTALSLSLNNLLTKKGRTLLTAFAGSIGIIGIALILALSSGVNSYIDRVAEDTLSAYPLEITQQAMNLTDSLKSLVGLSTTEQTHEDGKVYSGSRITNFMSAWWSTLTNNNLKNFKAYLEDESNGVSELVSGIQYGYETPLMLFREDDFGKIVQVNPSTTMKATGVSDMLEMSVASAGGFSQTLMSESSRRMNVFEPLLDNEELLKHQYKVLAGRFPEAMDEVVIILNSQNELSDYTLYTLGLKDQSELAGQFEQLQMGNAIESADLEFTYDELLGMRFRLLLGTDFYEKQGNRWVDLRNEDPNALSMLLKDAMEIKVVGILRPNEDSVATSASSGIGYRFELMEYVITQVNEAQIVQEQRENPDIDVFTGQPFDTSKEDLFDALDEMSFGEFVEQYGSAMGWTEEVQSQLSEMSSLFTFFPKDKIKQFLPAVLPEVMGGSYANNMTTLGVSDLSVPSSIYIYPKSFEAKTKLTDLINTYNASVSEENTIQYTDYIGLLMSSITDIINAVSYILIAFVAISLVVSSIMIGIITYISVLERTKEIGILRALGASKRDISRVFNAETLIVGFSAGVLGILVALVLVVVMNIIIKSLTGLSNLAVLPVREALLLVLISMVLTLIAGLIPSRMAANKDPVVALRTE
ncbi:MAG: ABC transporter ATP-binding protein/permease [Coriobacteriales bacterium]|nr:ABC transporter ATP-binding protein/permease [Coriobacteriales bacterium]